MILLIDNYDSFSYNVFQLVGSVNPDIRLILPDLMYFPHNQSLSSPDSPVLRSTASDPEPPDSRPFPS